jgi:hypothetical protein
MTDRTPQDPPSGDELGPDDDGVRDLGVLRGLGFDALSGGDAPFDGLDDVKARAERSTRHRRWTIGAAAAAALVVVGALGVLLAGTGEESAPDVYTGPPATEGERFLLPPADATDVGWTLGLDSVDEARSNLPPTEDVDFYRFEYETSAGKMSLSADRSGTSDATAVESVPSNDYAGVVGEPSSAPSEPANFSTNGSFWINCASDGAAVAGGALDEAWDFELRFVESGGGGECSPTALAPALASQTRGLRIVDESEWRRYLQDHRDTNTLDPANGPTTATTVAPTTTTTVPVAPPCDTHLMWEAARDALQIDEEDPGYEGFGPPFDGGYGVYGPVCIDDWAVGSVSRPSTQTTDAVDVFHWITGRWVYVGNLGFPISSCGAVERMGMPAEVFDQFWPDHGVEDAFIDRQSCVELGWPDPPPPWSEPSVP